LSAWANNRNRSGFVVPQKYSTTSVSGVSSRLSAPGKPWPGLDINFWRSAGVSAAIGFVINLGTSPLGGAIMGGILGGAGWYVLNLFRNWGSVKRTWQIHEARVSQYYESYYCKRDDVCFMPGLYSAQPEQYKSWLFQYN
jgi:hypothetical protein